MLREFWNHKPNQTLLLYWVVFRFHGNKRFKKVGPPNLILHQRIQKVTLHRETQQNLHSPINTAITCINSFKNKYDYIALRLLNYLLNTYPKIRVSQHAEKPLSLSLSRLTYNLGVKFLHICSSSNFKHKNNLKTLLDQF